MTEKSNDKLAIISKGVLGAVPFVGPLMAEVVGAVIPNQRIDRIEALLKSLEGKLDETDRINFEKGLLKSDSVDLVEDAFIQASRALSSKRTNYISALLKNSLTKSDIEYIEGKRLFAILGVLNDIEILLLTSHQSNYDGDNSFWEKHKDVLSVPSAHIGSSREELDKYTIAQTHRQNLVALNLLKPRFKTVRKGEDPEFDPKTGMIRAQGHEITPLGRLLLERLDIDDQEN